MKLRPLHDRVIVKRLEQETKTASGIVIPDNAAEKPDQGEVLAVGPGRKNDKGELIALNVKVGDRVLFGKYSGQTVKVDGDELLVVKEDDLFAVVEAPAAGLKNPLPPNSSPEVKNMAAKDVGFGADARTAWSKA